jgi:hypothetical protein
MLGTRDRSTCTNKLTIARQEVEARVLSALQDKLMRKDFFEGVLPRVREGVELRGNLAAMLAAAQQTKRSPETGDLFRADSIGCGGGI